jgi:hypothetical protein
LHTIIFSPRELSEWIDSKQVKNICKIVCQIKYFLGGVGGTLFQRSAISNKQKPAPVDLVHSLIVRWQQVIIRKKQKEKPSAVSGMPGFVFSVANLLQVAAVALGFARHADRATVMDELMREADPAALGQNPHQFLFYFLRRLAFGQSKPARNAKDVRVHHHAFGLPISHA